ncbi:MAG: sulfatase [Saprospiraceae bacterium]|nr:sulfatase [Saprospiraceae bacterium]
MKDLLHWLTLVLLFAASESSAQQPNVLFICIDDLRPDLGCYGHDLVQSPNIDGVAETGTIFKNHYVTVPTCGASRYGLLTGMLPRRAAELSNHIMAKELSIRPEGDRPETFVHHLRRNGYYTVGIGKISHSADGLVYGYEEEPSTQWELPHSWDERLFNTGKWGNGWNAFFGYADGSNRQSRKKQVKPYESASVEDDGYPDGLTADLAIEKIDELAAKGQPFFLGVGFFKPHLPFTAPKKYWDLYDRKSIRVTPTPGIPENVHRASLNKNGEFNNYQLGEERATLDKDLSDNYARKLRHGYYACISYTDAQVGRILQALEKKGLADNTIIVIWGDHGWHLGDHRVWGKHTVFERAVKSALIMKVPGLAPQQIEEVMSTIDIYPTIMSLCNLDMPYEGNGSSLEKLMVTGEDSDWRNLAFSYFRKGISMRTPSYRLTKYYRDEEPKVELYDHVSQQYERANIAPSNAKIVESLTSAFDTGRTGIYEQ